MQLKLKYEKKRRMKKNRKKKRKRKAEEEAKGQSESPMTLLGWAENQIELSLAPLRCPVEPTITRRALSRLGLGVVVMFCSWL